MKLIQLILTVVIIQGCSWRFSNNLALIDIGMTKVEVQGTIGNPDSVRGAVKNNYGESVQVWEYDIADKREVNAWRLKYGAVCALTAPFTFLITCIPMNGRQPPDTENYWLYFVDGRLAQWGKAGDWQEKEIREIRLNINPGPNL